MIKRKTVPKYPKYEVPVINLSSHQLADKEYQQLIFSLNHSIISKDKNVKKDITPHIEPLAYAGSKKVENIQLENFHEFLREYTDMFSKNVSNCEDSTDKIFNTRTEYKSKI